MKGSRLVRWVLPWVRVVMIGRFKLEVHDPDNIPHRGPLVLLPKHQRWEDIPLLQMAVARPLYYVAKHELFENPLAGRIYSSLGGIPLDRSKPLNSRSSFKRCVNLLDQGNPLVVFPEGTYFPDRMGPGRWGMVRFLLRNPILPLVPVGIQYLKGSYRTQVHIRLGRPVRKPDHMETDPFFKGLLKEIARLSHL